MRRGRGISAALALALASLAALESSAQAGAPGSVDPAPDLARLNAVIAGFSPRDPTTVLAQAAASEISYRIRRVPELVPASWPEYGVPAGSPVLGAYLVASPGGKAAWSPPDPELAKVLDEASKDIARKDFAAARALCENAQRAGAAGKGGAYFKIWTYIGYTYFCAENYPKAIECYQKALQTSPFGWEENSLEALALGKIGQEDEAFSRIALALTLNRNSQGLMNSLKDISAADGRRLDLLRLHLPFSFRKVDDKSCEVILCGAEGEEWYEAAICYATWRMEKSLIDVDSAYKSAGRFDDISFLEPLRCEVLSAKARLASGEKLGASARRLVGIDESGFFDQLVFWDIRLRWEPLAAYGLDEVAFKRLLDFLGTWVAPRRPPGEGNA
jgi:tetratricopeptide (TPR) repeat protein